MGFTNTRAALITYDAGSAQRQKLWTAADTNDDVNEAVAADRAALELVQAAFYEDTKAINTRRHCELADIQFMRHLVAGTAASTPQPTAPIEDRIGGWKK